MELTGLGQIQELAEKFSLGTTPTASTYNYRTQATADTEETLDLGDVATVYLIAIKAVTNELAVDLDFDAAFDSNFSIPEGKASIITKPAGTVKVKNETASETCVYEFVVVGIT